MKRMLMALVIAMPVSIARAEPTKLGAPPVAADPAPPLAELKTRFADGKTEEIPDFQRHVVPLLGRLGCNSRSCHGSFQGRGGFQLSLFGYDFKADYAALLEEDSARVEVDDVLESLILVKPTDAEMHEGGKRYDQGGWEYHVLRSWIAAGAPATADEPQKLARLEVFPAELRFGAAGEREPLRAVARWEDGTSEDVTGLCRFTTNDEAIATIDAEGLVTAGDAGDTHVVVSYDNAVIPVPVLRPVSELAGERYPQVATSTEVDALVIAKLSKLGILPSGICSDADFLRRVSLDLTGTLPSPEQVQTFLADDSADKRAKLVEELFESPGYAAWWATRFSDWTGNSEAQLNNVFPVRGAASQLWFEWLEQRIATHVPYDEIVEGIVTAESRMPGESYREFCEAMSAACREGGEADFAKRDSLPQFWARINLRMPEEKAIGFAHAFMGIRIQCAQCHKHPFDQWSKDDFDQFAKLFAPIAVPQAPRDRQAREQREEMLAALDTGDLQGNQLRRRLGELLLDGEVVPFPELTVRTAAARQQRNRRANPNRRNLAGAARVPTGKLLGVDQEISLAEDPRESLMEWLRDEQNPYFAPALVNRVWANYFGVGLVNPSDDLSLANPPSNRPLMDYLTRGFIESGFDLRWLHRTIVLSDTYQRSFEVNETNATDERNFSRFVPRRLPAEVVHDAVLLATASDEEAAELRNQLTRRAIANTYLINRQGPGNFALAVFGQSIRETSCDCDRSDDSSLLQSVFLRNDADVHARLTSPRGWVAQMGKEYQLSGFRQRDPQALRALQRQRQNLQKQLRQQYEKLRSLDPEQRQQQAPELRAQIERLRERLAEIGTQGREGMRRDGGQRDPEGPRQSVSPHDTERLTPLVEAAYLRSLGRHPEPQEIEASLAFIGESASELEGLEGVLWSLVNTKEFILNH